MPKFYWQRPRPRTTVLPFLSFDRERIICIPARPHEYAHLLLHRIDERGRSFPCQGEGCRWCVQPPFVHVYAPAYALSQCRRWWVPHLLDLTTPDAPLASAELCGLPVAVYASRTMSGARLLNLRDVSDDLYELGPQDHLPRFAVTPLLMRRYGAHVDNGEHAGELPPASPIAVKMRDSAA